MSEDNFIKIGIIQYMLLFGVILFKKKNGTCLVFIVQEKQFLGFLGK